MAELKKELLEPSLAYKLLGAAGFAGYMVLLFASIAAWWGLAAAMPSGWAALIVAFIWAVAGTVLYVLSRRMRDPGTKPRRTSKKTAKRAGSLEGMTKDLSGTLKRTFRR